MRLYELIESVNSKLFFQGYSKEKLILDGKIKLVASAGYVGYGSKPGFKSTQFRIVAKTPAGAEIGWVNFEDKDGALEALDLSIQPAYRRKGIASEMYKFAKELGNDIRPSKLQTSMGKQFWSKHDHNAILNETTEEDRALISLAQAIFDHIQQYADSDEQVINLGEIGELFDTPVGVLNEVYLSLVDDETMFDELQSRSSKPLNPNDKRYGFWDGSEGQELIILNIKYIPHIKSIISHELRHALDDYKSKFAASSSEKYTTAKKKLHKDSQDPHVSYEASRNEINARFLQVLDILVKRVPMAYKLEPSEIKPQLLKDFNNLLTKFKIAYLFPEKEKSPDYKRLLKRGYDFMQKEMSHIESSLANAGTPKVATGNW